MKLYKYLILSIVAASSFSSCLDEEPLYSQNNTVVFSSDSGAELALLGCYAYMTSTSAYGQHFQEIPVSGAGFSWSQRNGSDGIVSLQSLSSDGLISTTWNGMYKVISETNAFLENLDASGLSAETKNQFGGEAKFLRALAYYNLVSLWGDVPLKTVASTSEGISMPRTPKEQVLGQVVQDLNDALTIKETSDAGRINSWAVKAFLGKVYYKMAKLGINTNENLKNAKDMFDAVYNKHVYELEKNFADLFGDWVTTSKESIFQLNFALNSPSCFNRASNRFSPTGSTPGVCWSTYRATKAAYDMHQGTYPGDPRIAATFLTVARTHPHPLFPSPSSRTDAGLDSPALPECGARGNLLHHQGQHPGQGKRRHGRGLPGLSPRGGTVRPEHSGGRRAGPGMQHHALCRHRPPGHPAQRPGPHLPADPHPAQAGNPGGSNRLLPAARHQPDTH